MRFEGWPTSEFWFNKQKIRCRAIEEDAHVHLWLLHAHVCVCAPGHTCIHTHTKVTRTPKDPKRFPNLRLRVQVSQLWGLPLLVCFPYYLASRGIPVMSSLHLGGTSPLARLLGSYVVATLPGLRAPSKINTQTGSACHRNGASYG